MRFTSEDSGMGVVERGFEIEVAGERVPGIIWAPEGAVGPRPLILMGHGGTQNKRTDGILARARSYVRHQAWAVVSIDAPGHGDRTTPEQAAQARTALQDRMRSGTQSRPPEEMRQMAGRGAQHAAEWRATLDAVQKLDYVGEGPVGYWGVSMGTSLGAPFLVSDKRVRAAVLGLNGLRPGAEEFQKQAESLTIPLLFVFQWDDELVGRDAGIALFSAFGSKQKTMHINPGGHVQIPPFERESYESFYIRHLVAKRPQ